jgi:hypothetical protein
MKPTASSTKTSVYYRRITIVLIGGDKAQYLLTRTEDAINYIYDYDYRVTLREPYFFSNV